MRSGGIFHFPGRRRKKDLMYLMDQKDLKDAMTIKRSGRKRKGAWRE
jgi:hypothetical protein